jgi:hypothetical protein
MTSPTRVCALAVMVLVAAAPAVAQLPVDDLRVRQLEAEIRRLQQQVEAQARRIELLEQAARITPPAVPSPSAGRVPDGSPAWLVTANWDRVMPGMTVLEVVAILGRPTSTRRDADDNLSLLFYAMELGPERYLSGTIRVENSSVVEIDRPALK